MFPFRELLLEILLESVRHIEEPYFNLPIAESNSIKRERVYCAELYHQLRQRIGAIPYTVNAEPDKKKHPVIEEHCGPVNPDLVIHNPGGFGPEDNLAVIEIKSTDGNLYSGIDKDMRTISCMTGIENGYYFGILIIFGALSDQRRNALIKRVQTTLANNTKTYFLIFHYSGDQTQVIEF